MGVRARQGVRGCRRPTPCQGDRPRASAHPLRHGGEGNPAAGDADRRRRRGHVRLPLADARNRDRNGLRAGRPGTARDRADDRRPRPPAPGPRRQEADLQEGGLSGSRRELSRRPEVPRGARLGPCRGRRGRARHHLVRRRRARRARSLRAARGGRHRDEGPVLRRGRVGEGCLRRDRTAHRGGARGEPAGSRRPRDGERGSVRQRLAASHPRRGSGRDRRPARRRCLPGTAGEPVTHPFLALTDSDRDEMLGTIGVSSVEELFRDLPEAVRFGRELELERALSEQEVFDHVAALAARNSDASRELSFLGAGMYDHYVPAVVDAILQRGELLTAYTPYQPEMSQGVLQAIFEYQTAVCELTGMDVSNASGYDGTTVAGDACFVAKHATGRSKVVVTEATGPQIRQVVKTYAPGFGLEVVEVPHREGATDPDELREAAQDAACVIFQQPNFFGVLEPAPDLAAAAADAGALPVAHVDPISLGLLEAPGRYGCALAIGEGQSAGNYLSYGGPHYGFLAARSEFIRRMPGRISGETVDSEGRRGFVLTLQTREQHIRREKAT